MKTPREYYRKLIYDDALPFLLGDTSDPEFTPDDMVLFAEAYHNYATQAKGGSGEEKTVWDRIEKCRHYLMSTGIYDVSRSEALNSLGFTDDGLNDLYPSTATPPVTPQDVKQHKGYHMSDGDTSSTPPVTPQDDEKQNVFSRDECIFTYCPHPEECKDVCQCTADDLNKKIEKNNKVIEKMRDLSNIDMNAPYGATQQPTPSTHSEVGETKVIQKQDSAYHLACQNCGTSSKPLQMIPFRNDNNVVGLLTSCEDCKDILYGQRFDREEKLTPTKPVEITEEEIEEASKFIDWFTDWDDRRIENDEYFGFDIENRVRADKVKAILTKLKQ